MKIATALLLFHIFSFFKYEYSPTWIPQIKWEHQMCSSMLCSNLKKTQLKQACLFGGLSVQLLMVLIANSEGRLLTSFSQWLGSIVARPTFHVTQTLDFHFNISRFFFVDSGFLFVKNDKQSQSLVNLQICLTKEQNAIHSTLKYMLSK